MKYDFKFLATDDFSQIIYQKARFYRDKLNQPLVKKLVELKISADEISYFRFFLALVGVYFVGINNWFAVVCWIIFMYLDSLDGALARFTHSSSKKGLYLDMAIDLLINVFFLLKLIYAGYLGGFWGAFYLSGFLITYFLLSIINYSKKIPFPLFPSVDFFKLFFVFYIIWGFNYFDFLAVFLSIFSYAKNFFLVYEFIKISAHE